MKVIGIIASPRRDGNTADLTNHALKCLRVRGIETEVYNLFDFKITPCGVECSVECYENVIAQGRICPVDNEDDLLKLIKIIKEAEGVILATPCYSLDIPAQLKAYIERSELKEFNDKVVGIIAIASLGGIHMVSTITSNLIHHSHSTVAGWAILTRFYPKKGQAIKDENSIKSIERLVEQMYSVLQQKRWLK